MKLSRNFLENKVYRIVSEDRSHLGFRVGLCVGVGENRKRIIIRLLKGQFVGDNIKTTHSKFTSIRFGDACKLKYLPLGSKVCNVGGIYCLSGGSFGIIKMKLGGNVIVRLRSGKSIFLNGNVYSRLGVMSSTNRVLREGYAGYWRNLGKRPKVSRKAKNAYDRQKIKK